MVAAPYHASHRLAEAEAPRKPYVLGAWLAYDPHETLEQFFVRRADALAAGDQAWREGKIKAHHQKLYERLVDAVGAHQYCWVKVETLADEFKANESTIKRWLTSLEQAQLIRRQRQFKSSSRTYLVAYDQWRAPVARDDQAEHEASDEPQLQPDALQPASNTSIDEQSPNPHAAARNVHAASAEVVFFEREDAPTYSAFLPPHVKDLPLNTLSDSGGVNGEGEPYKLDITKIEPEIQMIITQEEINTDRGKRIVAACPVEELRAVQRYLNHQTNVRDRPGLFVWLNERHFGAELLTVPARSAERQRGAPESSPTQRLHRRTRAAQEEQHIRHNQYDACCAACGERSIFLCNLNDPFCDQCGVRPGDTLGTNDELTPDPELWQAILSRVGVAPAERDLWLAPVMIAHYENLLVLVCPHKLVRTMIRMCYLDHINAAVAAILGRPVTIETTVKHMFRISAQQHTAWLNGQAEQAVSADDARNDGAEHASAAFGPAAEAEQEIWTCNEGVSVLHHGGTRATSTPMREENRQEIDQRIEKRQPTRSDAPARAESVQKTRNAMGDTANLTHGVAPANGVSARSTVPLPPPLNAIWQMVLQHMTVSQNEWRVWLEPTYLFHLNDTCAVVGTPNMFVRDEVANRYQNQLEAALSVVVGRALRIEVVTSSNAAMRA